VPSELEGIAYIEVVIAKESIQLAGATLSQPSSLNCDKAQVHASWQKQLEAAQNVLFCKELFSQLAREAIQLQAPIPHLVVGNQIAATLFPDIQLVISLRHTTGTDRTGTSGSGAATAAKDEARPTLPQSSNEHSHVLEHSLHQLLRLQHSRNLNPDHQALSTAAVGIPKRRRLAGPRAADRQSLVEMATQKTLLEQIIQQAQHVVVRMRTMFVLDSMARDCKDPLITCHWGTLSSPTRTSVKVSIVTAGYDTVHRTQFVIHVGENKLTVVCKDGRVADFSHESQELVDFLKLQISQHQVLLCNICLLNGL
jgi:mediator of RNA polymerase II transcription subunit 17